jgi:hypothetical protein
VLLVSGLLALTTVARCFRLDNAFLGIAADWMGNWDAGLGCLEHVSGGQFIMTCGLDLRGTAIGLGSGRDPSIFLGDGLPSFPPLSQSLLLLSRYISLGNADKWLIETAHFFEYYTDKILYYYITRY